MIFDLASALSVACEYFYLDFHLRAKSLSFFALEQNLKPSSLFQKCSGGYYPITHAKKNIDIAQYLLKRALKYNPHHHSIGGLISTCDNGETLLQTFISRFGRQRTWDMLEREISPYKNVPILHRMIEHAPEETMEVFNRFPHSIYLRDEKNRLPIHVALEKGMNQVAKWIERNIAFKYGTYYKRNLN